MPKDKLSRYNKKRDISKTKELGGSSGSKSNKNIFVNQAHQASNPHIDFRIHAEVVLKSWVMI